MARFLIYSLAPVPLALFCLLGYGVLTGGPVPSIEGLAGFLGLGVVGGYAVMGLQSAAFALMMLWLERRGVARASRCIFAAAGGCLFGATVVFAADELLSSLSSTLGVIGAIVGPVVVLIADLLAGPSTSSRSSWARQREGSAQDAHPNSTHQTTGRAITREPDPNVALRQDSATKT
ncbi:MAG: hypothetical protein AB7T19_17790 [Planctomycetota bacterium]